MIGRHLNNYEVVSLLGEGGMGTVYLALHPIMGRKAAVKVLKPELAKDQSLVTRFFNEARAANAIRHPNIIDIIDVGMLPEDNVPYMLMEFLEGESLASRLDRSRPLDAEQAVEIGFQTASALAAAHSKGIVHRDLKPDNLFLVPDEMVGSGERVKVLDFGIAKLRDDLRGSSMKTRTGAIMGTAAYMSPEQCQGLIEKIDHRTDIYALGIILYEMVCGAPPFISEGFGDIIIMHVMKEAEPPHQKNPAVPFELSAAILRALAKSPADRFQSMNEFQAALRAQAGWHTGPIHLTPPVGTTAILNEPQPGSRLPSYQGARSPSGLAFDVTITPAPESVTPPPYRTPSSRGQPPAARGPTPPGEIKQTTTFRNATGETMDTDLTGRGTRRTALAVATIVGLAAAGLAVTLLVTRSASKPASPDPAAAAAPVAEPAPAPTPEPKFTPPPPAALPPPPPVVEDKPVAPDVEPAKSRPKKGKGKKGAEAGPARPDRPSPPPPPPQPANINTERW